mgnify:CR=1 FL=1
MTDSELLAFSESRQRRAWDIVRRSRLMEIWLTPGRKPCGRLVGDGTYDDAPRHRPACLLLAADRRGSFAAMARLAEDAAVKKIECRNLLDTDEACIEWHAWYDDGQDGEWQIDIIHILKGSRYDGYFERMAERVKAALTDDTRLAILRLKAGTPENEHVMGVEYYQAVLRDGVRTMADFKRWRAEHPVNGVMEWMP